MTLAHEDANSELVGIFTVADAWLKFNLGRDSEARFGQDFGVQVQSQNADVWLRF